MSLAFAIMYLNGCASKGAISGGPEDKTPPEVVESIPAHLSLNVSADISVEIKFSERMNRSSVEKSIFISPLPEIEPEFKWKGYKKLRILFQQPLETERTYVINIGSSSSDMHKNKMEKSYSLAFSTGDRIDKGKITGKVYGKYKTDKTFIYAYQMNDSMDFEPDTLLPDYITQAGKTGEFELEYLAFDKYRLFAVEENGNNREYDLGKDRISVPVEGDVEISISDSSGSVSFFGFSIIDTLSPKALAVFPVDNKHLTFRTTEPLVLPGKNDSIWIVPIEGGEKKSALLVYPDVESRSKVHLHFEIMTGDAEYELYLGALKDSAGYKMDSSSVFRTFTASSVMDTIPPSLIKTVPGSGAKLVYPGDKIRLMFSEALTPESIASAVSIINSDSQAVDFSISSSFPNRWELSGTGGWDSNEKHTLKISLNNIEDIYGNTEIDSIRIIRFHTVNKDTLGIISGRAVNNSGNGSPIYVTAMPVNGKSRSQTSRAQEDGKFRLEDVLPGKYFLNAFRDKDGNGRHTPGLPVPYTRAEPFFQGTDTVFVRSRWETADHEVVLIGD
ncbi:MAG: Ig-like domain-containing protein [Candidatus Marinimicrobia bacterium]|nr:Ig-like domain-containing protein [Candidatus Neomarinimicrobiota bacterium]